MAQSESSGNYGILTDAGGGDMVAGAYQFGDARLEDFMDDTGEKFTREDFLASQSYERVARVMIFARAEESWTSARAWRSD